MRNINHTFNFVCMEIKQESQKKTAKEQKNGPRRTTGFKCYLDQSLSIEYIVNYGCVKNYA